MLDIVFISPHCDPQAVVGEPDSGGQCIYEHELALALSGLPDLRVTTFCRQQFQRPDESIINNSYSIRRIQCGQTSERIPKEELESVLGEFAQKVHTFISEQLKPEMLILHGHYWDGAYVCLSLKALSTQKVPFIWTPHSLGSTKHRKFPGDENEFAYHFIPRRCWENYGSVFADSIILSSQEEKSALIHDYAVDENKIQIVPPGINLPQFERIDQAEARQKFGLPLTGRIALCLGRMVKTKGYHHAIQALAELNKINAETTYLAIFGGSNSNANHEESKYISELRQLVDTLGLQEQVLFMPAVDHARVNEVFSAADVFLMPSEHEPFGLVTLESMAMRVPVIAANSGGSLNLIVHNQTGILVNFHQPARVAQYMLSLFMDEPLHTRMADKSYRYVRNEYDWYQKSGKFAQAYWQVSRFQATEQFQAQLAKTFFLQQHFER